MFVLIRKTLTIVIIAAGSIVLWESAVPSGFKQDITAETAGQEVETLNDDVRGDEIGAGFRDSGGMNIGQRLIIWVLFVILLPIVTAPLSGRITDRESNAANVLMLFGYTGLGIFAAHAVNLLRVTGLLTSILFLMTLLAVFAYNLWICGYVAGLREK